MQFANREECVYELLIVQELHILLDCFEHILVFIARHHLFIEFFPSHATSIGEFLDYSGWYFGARIVFGLCDLKHLERIL